ncbi:MULTISPECIES: hypothetical protein [unclassified Cupriavidus]|uniref:hypothetical protein n=1 Tax=Cupriavidus sp. H19C3 TaxID=3241603 RepID=UPI003BF7DBB0
MTTRLDLLAPPEGPLAGTSNAAAARVSKEAWQSEMERAQAQQWFKPALNYRQHAATAMAALPAKPDGRPAAAEVRLDPGRATQGLAIESVRLALDLADVTAARADAPASHPLESTQVALDPAFAQQSRLGVPGRGGMPLAAPGDVAALASVPEVAAKAAGVLRPVRIHLETGAGGAHLWIGANTGATDQILQAIAEVRRRLDERGIALTRITCNGKPWHDNQTAAGARIAQRQDHPDFMEGAHDGIDR